MCENKIPGAGDEKSSKKDYRQEIYEGTDKPRLKKQRQGPLNWRGFVVLSVAFGGLGVAYAYLRALRLKEQEVERKKEVGKASIGGPWDNLIGKKHALKKYDQFFLNTSCFWGNTRSNITPVVQFHEIFVTT